MRTRVLPEILSGTLQVRVQVYNYFAFLVRYGQSICVIQGTGLAAPTGSIDSSITLSHHLFAGGQFWSSASSSSRRNG